MVLVFELLMNVASVVAIAVAVGGVFFTMLSSPGKAAQAADKITPGAANQAAIQRNPKTSSPT